MKIGKLTSTQTRKAYQLWAENSFHPSLHFKCINNQENIWSVRVTRGYRALGFKDADTQLTSILTIIMKQLSGFVID